jgi:CDP-glucose 4,6-dehydratase
VGERRSAVESVVIPDATFWSGRRVLVTGHTGFKGAWLTRWLESMGATVAGFALAAATDPNLSVALDLPGGSPFDDIRDPAQIRDALLECEPEIVFHLAAQAFVLESMRDPAATFASNVAGTANLLDAVLTQPSVRTVVVVTSDKVYRPGTVAHREGDPLGGNDPYSASKAGTELVVHSYRSSIVGPRDLALVTARAGNVIGGGDWGADRIVPDLVRAFAAGVAPVLRHPAAVRPWQHVLEPLRGYLLLAEAANERRPSAPAAVNFGPPEASHCTVGELVDRFTQDWPDAPPATHAAGVAHAENPCLRLNSELAGETLGWYPVLDLADAIDWTASWYTGFAGGADARDLCDEQIDDYTRRAA